MDISIARDGQVIAQVTREQAYAGLRSGELRETDYYWQAGLVAWRPLPLLFAAQVKLPFSRPVPLAPTLLDRILRRKSASECLAAYWDLLATAPDHGAVAAADLEALDAACGCKVRSRCDDTLRQWHEAYVAMALSDGAVSGDERATLGRVAAAFGIPPARAEEALRAAVVRHYAAQVPLLLRTEQPVETTLAAIRRLETALGLPADETAALRAPLLEDYFKFLIGGPGSTVTPLVSRAIRTQAAAFGFDLAARGDLAKQLALGEQRWEAEHGVLPVVETDLILGRGEVCHWHARAELMQMKRVTVGVTYGGPVATIRIFKGLSWRMASYRGTRETSDDIVSLDKGVVFITNRRVLFNGPLKNLAIKLERVMDVNGFKNAFQVEQPTGISPYFVIESDPVVPYRMLTRLCREAQS